MVVRRHTGRTRETSPLGKPWIVTALCNQLAEGRIPRTRLAEQYGVAGASITAFAKRHAERIEALKADASAAVRDVWVADKAARLEMLRELIERLAPATERSGLAERVEELPVWEKATHPDTGGLSPDEVIDLKRQVMDEILLDVIDEKLTKRLMEALRQVADELGDLPARTAVQSSGVTVNYTIEGIDPESLR